MSSGLAVFDSSPLIVFHQIDHLELLSGLFLHILVPNEVALEVAPTFGKLPPWIDEQQVPATPVLPQKLDAGERAAIALAVGRSADFVALDDLAGRRVAAELGLTVIGSLGLLIRAQRNGLIRDVRPVIDQMVAAGLYVSEQLYREVLEAADEED